MPIYQARFQILDVTHLYKQRKFNEFLRRTEFKLGSAKDKVWLKECINEIGAMSDRPIAEVIDHAEKHGLVRKDDAFTDFVTRKPYLFNRLMPVKLSSYLALYEYLEGRTTYSTQHKIKGREFDRVLVVLDLEGGTSTILPTCSRVAGQPPSASALKNCSTSAARDQKTRLRCIFGTLP
jgi:DNA helicase-2/ATP-dependent DNA helicase PcrA